MTPCEVPDLLSQDTGSWAALAFLKDSLEECCRDHGNCTTLDAEIPYHPSRVIDVGLVGDDLVWLRDTSDWNIQEQYVCLSHCWGEFQPYTLTKETVSELVNGLSIRLLPKTFRDAIEVTRHLGIRFVW
jgi:hypothetical protein